MKELLKHLTLVDFIVEMDDEIKSGKFQFKHYKSKGLQYYVQQQQKQNGKYSYHCLCVRKKHQNEHIVNTRIMLGSVNKTPSQDIREISMKKYHEFVLKKFGKSIEDFRQEKKKWETLSLD